MTRQLHAASAFLLGFLVLHLCYTATGQQNSGDAVNDLTYDQRRGDITTIPCNPVPTSNGRRNCSVSIVEVLGTIPLAPGSIASSGAPVSGVLNTAAPAPELLASNSAAPAPAGSALTDRSLASVIPSAKESTNYPLGAATSEGSYADIFASSKAMVTATKLNILAISSEASRAVQDDRFLSTAAAVVSILVGALCCLAIAAALRHCTRRQARYSLSQMSIPRQTAQDLA